MYSKMLNDQDRRNILRMVQDAATEKRQDPEMLELEAKASDIIQSRQLELVSDKDGRVLDKYVAFTESVTISITVDNDGRICNVPFSSYEPMVACPRVKIYRLWGMRPVDYPHYSDEIIKYIESVSPDLFPRFCELWEWRAEMVHKTVAAFEKLLDLCETSEQAANARELRPFIPEYLLKWQPDEKTVAMLDHEEKELIEDLLKDK